MVNGKGFVSPVYYTTTNPDGSFAFDLSKPVTDENGNTYDFNLAGDPKFAIRTWVKNPDPSKYDVVKHGDQMYGYHDRLTRKMNLGTLQQESIELLTHKLYFKKNIIMLIGY